MSESAWEQWRQGLQTHTDQHFTSQQLAEELKKQTGVGYSHSHWVRLLREREGMYYYKPRPRDYRRSETAPE